MISDSGLCVANSPITQFLFLQIPLNGSLPVSTSLSIAHDGRSVCTVCFKIISFLKYLNTLVSKPLNITPLPFSFAARQRQTIGHFEYGTFTSVGSCCTLVFRGRMWTLPSDHWPLCVSERNLQYSRASFGFQLRLQEQHTEEWRLVPRSSYQKNVITFSKLYGF